MAPSHANFCHPYQPYSIQLEFMQNLYRCIEEKKVGIFESPTGTGKSLSLICGALTWLRDHERQSLQGNSTPGAEDDWLVQAEQAAQRRELLAVREDFERKLAKIREEEARRRLKRQNLKPAKKLKTANGELAKGSLEDEFMLDDYNSDNEVTAMTSDSSSGFSSATQALLDKLQGPAKKEAEEQDEDRLKIIFCSRTHSQLTQFVNELRRVKPPRSVPAEMADSDALPQADIEEGVKHLALGSRKNLCVNPRVANLTSTTAINEQCLELQKPGMAKDKKCSFLPSKDDKERVEAFRDRVLAEIKDIEDVGNLGRDANLCPYYASRSAINATEILTLPYPLLLQKPAREALGVSVKDNVVMIDEAHNLADAIADTLSISLRLSQLDQAIRQVTAYATRFKNKLKGKNRVYLMQVIRLLNSITDCLKEIAIKPAETTVTAAQLMSGKGVDQIKPHKMLQYLHESKLCRKVEGYTEAQETDRDSVHSKGVLMQFQNFLAVLMNPDDEGRFFASRQDEDVIVRYTLLDPRQHFRQVVQDARAVILAGGTMSPMSDYSDYLFSYLEKERIETFSFGHVIPASNLLAQTVVKGPSGVEFDFTFEKRGSEGMIVELGNLILKVCRVVPDGTVVFFPSYDYLAKVVSIWQRLPTEQPIMTALERAKPVFQESKAVAVDELLRSYASAVDTGKGALMLSVVGGKLSEGINFSDKLGRAVIAVGLPFPNANGAEWKAKMQHIEDVKYQQCRQDGKGDAESRNAAKSASREYYENACMRSVNQSIGRAIRHKNDYAAILMVDRRFATDRIRRKLPGWIQGSMGSGVLGWGGIETGLQDFFREKQ
ncbi:ATP-dependent DNA helicase chl1 [Cladophialophora chaetospira]|uniref:ATP-dependent DNA helicase CHL1 n=1 Tax=Cladophialophora chaetospira TaxID=386627 RepID=A0AA38XE12_9EURO|nr:ATP-dependent DNA helicase chl1 [Cladophialophora chaetospira]